MSTWHVNHTKQSHHSPKMSIFMFVPSDLSLAPQPKRNNGGGYTWYFQGAKSVALPEMTVPFAPKPWSLESFDMDLVLRDNSSALSQAFAKIEAHLCQQLYSKRAILFPDSQIEAPTGVPLRSLLQHDTKYGNYSLKLKIQGWNTAVKELSRNDRGIVSGADWNQDFKPAGTATQFRFEDSDEPTGPWAVAKQSRVRAMMRFERIYINSAGEAMVIAKAESVVVNGGSSELDIECIDC